MPDMRTDRMTRRLLDDMRERAIEEEAKRVAEIGRQAAPDTPRKPTHPLTA